MPMAWHDEDADQDAGGHDEDGDEFTACVEKEEDADEADDDHFFDEGVAKSMDGAFDDGGTVVGSLDEHAGGEAVFKIGEFGLGVLDDLIGVSAEAGDDDAADGFAVAVPFCRCRGVLRRQFGGWPRRRA